jgi:hypothetical protein
MITPPQLLLQRREELPARSEAMRAGAVHVREAGHLRHAVALVDDAAGRVHERAQLPRQRQPARQAGPQPAAEAIGDAREQDAPGALVVPAELGGQRPPGHDGVAVALPDLERPLELRLGLGAGARRRGGGLVEEALVERRPVAEERGPYVLQVLAQRVRRAERGQAADLDREPLHHHPEHPRHRHHEQVLVLGPERHHVGHQRGLDADVVVGEDRALGRAGRARGVDDAEPVGPLELRDAGGDRARVRLRPGPAARAQLRPGHDRQARGVELGQRHDAPALLVGLGQAGPLAQHDDALDRPQLGPALGAQELPQQGGILDEQDPGPAVADHPLDPGARVAAVDRDADAAGAQEAQIGRDRLGAALGQDAGAIALLQPELQQARRGILDLARDLAPRELRPPVLGPLAEREPRAALAHAMLEHLDGGGVAHGHGPLSHGVAIA